MARTARTSKRFALVAGFLAAFLVVLGATTFLLYEKTRTHMDEELGAQLRSIATGIAHLVEVTSPDSLLSESISPEIYSVLFSVQEENDLSNIVVLMPDGSTIIDVEGYADSGQLNPFIDLDYSAVALARSGLASYTSLYRTGDLFMKSAYAPVTSGVGDVIAIVGVEAGAAFFATLRQLLRMIILFTVVSAGVVFILGALFYRQSRALDQAEETVFRQENLAAMGRMVANIAHEIRNPLSIMKTSAERLRRKYELEDEAVDYIIEEVDSLNGVLTGYLEFATSTPDEFDPQPLQKIIARCVLAAQQGAIDRQVQIQPSYCDESVVVLGDEKQLRQAILNVLLNGVQATPPGSKVCLSLLSNPSHGVVVITDEGPGIEKDRIEQVTKPFYTTKAGGSGLGLSIVQGIIEQHHGKLDISSNTSGTTVRLTFPLATNTPAKGL